MVETLFAASMQVTGTAHNSQGQGRHRLKRALHSQGDACHLEIQMQGHGGWQPACTVKEEALAKYFASQADRNIRRRKGAES